MSSPARCTPNQSPPARRTRAGTSRPALVRLGAAAAATGLLVTLGQVAGLPAASAATAPVGWLHTSGSTIRTTAGAEHRIKAVNWFGMETTNCAPHGLWTISLDAGLQQIAAMGFNTVRLPYSNECLRGAPVSGVDPGKNPSLVGKSSLQVMDAVIQRAGAHGLSVILDRHRPSSAGQSDLWYTSAYSEKAWIDDWVMLARRYAATSTVIGADLHNEPHGAACWGCGDPARDWAAAATRAGNAVLAANPRLLVVVEGVEQQGSGETTWWGAGLSDVARRPVVLSVPQRVVYSPHEYPASVFPQKWFSAPGYPGNLPAQWDRTWGYLQKNGTAPVLVGEFGTKLETTSDRQWLDTFVSYLRTTGTSFSYWSFNPNSGDTGGLVQDDWRTPQTAKLTRLAPLLAVSTPSTPTPSTPTPTPSTPTPSTPTATPVPSPSAPPSSPAPSSPAPSSSSTDATWQLQSSWTGGHVASLRVAAGAQARQSWTVSWADADARSVVEDWGMTCSVAAQRVTCRGSDWGQTVPAGGSVTAGVQVSSVGPAPSGPVLNLS